MLSNIGTTEIVVLGLILFVFFGGRKLPEFAKGVGEAMREVKKASRD